MTRSVSVARRTRPTIASGLGLRDAMWPPVHSESIGTRLELLHLPRIAAADDPDLDVTSGHGHRSTSSSSARSLVDRPEDRVEHVVVVLTHQRAVTQVDVEVGEEPRLAHDAGAAELGVLDVDEHAACRRGADRSPAISFVITAIAGTPAAWSASNASRDDRARVHAAIASSISARATRRAVRGRMARPPSRRGRAPRRAPPIRCRRRPRSATQSSSPGGAVDVVRRELAVSVADSDRPGNTELLGEERVGCAGGDDLTRREVDVLALTGARPVQQRGEHRDRQRAPAAVVGRLADLGRWTVGVAGLLATVRRSRRRCSRGPRPSPPVRWSRSPTTTRR